MGKGTGCFPSKGSKAVGTGSTPVETQEAGSTPTKADEGDNNVVEDSGANTSGLTQSESPAVPAGEKIKVFIVFYSMYGHVLSLARKMKEGVDSVEGCEGCLFQVPETLPDEVLAKMGAPAKDNAIPTIKAADLPAADACLFGFPTRYGAMAAQMKAFFDSTGSLWQRQSLAGKPAGLFVSTGTQGGGQETTALTAITQLVHHGMVFVPIGYTFGAGMFMLDEPRGGSPYGTGTFAGDGTKMPTVTELAMAEHQGKLTARVAKLLVQRN